MSLKILKEKGLLHLTASRLNKEKVFWEELLNQDFQKSVIPGDLFLQGEKAFQECYFGYPAGLIDLIDKLTNQQESRLLIFYAAVLSLLVHKFTNETRVTFAIPNSEHHPSMPESPFLILQVTIAPERKVRQLLNEVKNNYLQVVAHRAYPLEIFEEQGSASKLYDVFLAVNDQLEKTAVYSNRGNLVLSLQRLGGTLKYNSKTYSDSKALSIARYFQHLIQVTITNIDQAIGSMEIILPEEKEQLFHAFNATHVPFERNKLFLDFFKDAVKRFPARSAALYNQSCITYQDLDNRSAQLAQLLYKSGVRKQDVIAILHERSIDFLIAILAIMKTGAVFVGIDIDMPVNRMLTILKESGTKWLITNKNFVTDIAFMQNVAANTSVKCVLSLDLLNRIEKFTQELPCRILDMGSVNDQPITDPDVNNAPDDQCYQIFSSGSTGKPKGILLHHLGMINHFNGLIRNLGITENDCMAQTASCSFDIYVMQMLMPLVAGARTHFMERSVLLNPDDLFAIVTKGKVTLLELVPSLINVLLSHVQDQPAGIFTSLRYLLSNGEQLKTSLVQKWFSCFPDIPVVNAYGPAEASDDVSIHIIEETDESLNIVPIGKPLNNIQIYITDRFNQLSPIGVEGEICISGIAVGKGYLHDPIKTSNSFVPNPFAHLIEENRDDYNIMFKTGDIGLWQQNGLLMYKGRADFMVKIRGVRIELAEVETVLLKYKTIVNVFVTDYMHQDEKMLCAYFEERSPTDLEDLDSFLRSELPDTMIPSCMMRLDKIPCNENGKVDRSKLPAPSVRAASIDIDLSNQLIKKLWEIWKEVLGSEELSITNESNFFQLGGHSLTAVQLVAHINRKFGINISIVQVFKLRTFGAMAGLIGTMKEGAVAVLKKAGNKPYYNVSSAQRRFYVHTQLYPEDLSYNCPQFCMLKGRLQVEKVKQAFVKLLQAHEVFRTSFTVINNLPMQVVHEQVDFELLYSECAKENLDQHIAGFVYPFELSKAPLLRVQLVKYKEEEHLLFVDMHHIISDELSDQIVLQHFLKAYAGQDVAPPAFQYKDYAEWEFGQLNTNKFEKQEQYWLKVYATLPSRLQLPYDYDRRDAGATRGNDWLMKLTIEHSQAISTILQRTETTAFMFFLAVFNLVLKNLSGSSDIVVGTPVSGRENIELEPVVGPFLNQLALRNNVATPTTFNELLLQVKENCIAALASQVYPFDVLTSKLGLQGRLKETPLYNVMFAHLRRSNEPVAVNGLEISNYPVPHHSSKAELQLTVLENDDYFELLLTVDAGLFGDATALQMLDYCKKMLDAVIKDPGLALSAIPYPEELGLLKNMNFKRRELSF